VSIFDVDAKRAELARLQGISAKPGFWDDQPSAQKTMAAISEISSDINTCDELLGEAEDLSVLHELSLSERDEATNREAMDLLSSLSKRAAELEVATWFSDHLDSHDAIISIHPGAGGLESQDWAEMLLRMYTRYCERKGWRVDLNEVTGEEEAGIKNATFTVHGRYAYGYLRAEKGVHRLVRISPYDFQKRRHTSFASVDVLPLLGEEVEVEIDPKDLRIDTYRSSSAGGQHVNVTDSAVRVTHVPTGIVAQCQNERSQLQNKATAMEILRARLYERMQEERTEELEKIRGARKDIGFGSQIRSYVLHPYSLAKDHRTNLEKGNVQGVLDGDLDDFIVAYHRETAGKAE